MRVLSVILVCVGVLASWVGAQFLNNKPFPTYSLESMPDTGFTCSHKIVGSYYADIETQCQMFHICVRVAGLGVQDFRFLCPNGTAFDQDHQICAEWEDVDCDSSTLYYASDNFDLYRIGSGFESKAVKYGEEEEVFSLQRAETGDLRINNDEQVHRVNQQKQLDNPYFRKQKTQQRNDDEIFKGSSSSNFFNNKNGGKEVDDDEDVKNVNFNQDRDQEQRRKVNRHQSRRPVKQQTQAPQQQDTQTQRPSRPTGFINNFAGSSVVTTTRPTSTTEQFRRQNVRKQYSNADNFRQSARNNEEQNYPSTTYTISTPAPFRTQTQQSNQPTTYSPKKIDNTYTKEPENYPSNFPKQRSSTTAKYDNYDNSYDIPKVKNTQNYPSTNQQAFEKKPTTAFKQNDFPTNPTTFAPKTAKPSTFNAQSNFPSTFSPRTNSGYTQISQQTTQQQKQNTQNTQQYNTQNTQYNTQYNAQTTQYNTQPPQQRQSSQQHNTQAPQQRQSPQQHNTQASQQRQSSQQHNTQAPQQRQSSQQYDAQSTQYDTQKQHNAQTTQYNTQPQRTQSTQQYTTQAPQSTQQQNGQNTQYNTQFTSQNTQTRTQNTQQFNTRTTQLTTSKPSPFTQYTPTVPKITSTTPVSRSNRFDETHYDDGSYNSKYDSYDNQDEFLKTAHSTNIASSRNELAKAAKATVSTTSKPYYESPRPFSITQNTPKVTEQPKTTPKATHTQNSAPAAKKEKNASYDYAYYDTNTQNEPEYEIDTDFKKSTAKN